MSSSVLRREFGRTHGQLPAIRRPKSLGSSGGAFARVAHITRLDLRNNRVVVAQMEPRSAIGAFEPESWRYTLRLGCQGAFGMKALLKGVLGVEPDKVRVLTGNVGGSFGMKATLFPEYPCLLLAAKLLGRPVKWTDERSESFLSDSHGRDHETAAELALDADRGKYRRGDHQQPYTMLSVDTAHQRSTCASPLPLPPC